MFSGNLLKDKISYDKFCRGAILVGSAEYSAGYDLLLARLVAFDTFSPAVAVREWEFCVFVVIELQFLAAPTLHAVAGFALGAHL